MFIERAEIPVKEGMEADFAAAMATRGTAILESAPGCSKVTVGRGVENPGKFILLLEWDSVESHTALTKTDFGCHATSAKTPAAFGSVEHSPCTSGW